MPNLTAGQIIELIGSLAEKNIESQKGLMDMVKECAAEMARIKEGMQTDEHLNKPLPDTELAQIVGSLASYMNEIEELVNGLTKPLTEIDPRAAFNVRASDLKQ